jgi:hypothetical protein
MGAVGVKVSHVLRHCKRRSSISRDHAILHTLCDVKEVPRVPSIAASNMWRHRAETTALRQLAIPDEQGQLVVVMTHNTDISDTWERGRNKNTSIASRRMLRRRRQHHALRDDALSAEGRSAHSAPVTEVVEAEGHLIDSQLMNAMFDTVVRHDAAFDVLEFGSTAPTTSRRSCRCA